MLMAQAKAKTYVDQTRFVRNFDVGYRVFLKMTPRKSQLRLGKCYKLSLKYCGLFQILKKIGTMSYELGLPSGWRIHNVFQMSF
jgi:hypothetical protein